MSRGKMGQAWLLCLLLLSMLVSPALMQSDPLNRILNGQQAYPGELPCMAVLQSPDGNCSASIITQNWLVTAAHCTLDQEVHVYQVIAGIVDLRLVGEKAQTREVENIIPHPNYQYVPHVDNVHFDICLVNVKEPFEWSKYIKPISLACTYESYEPGQCFATGFGETNPEMEPSILALQRLSIDSTVTDCGILNNHMSTLDHHICYEVHNFTEQHLNGGDFGGPLVCNGESVGVATAILYPPVETNEEEVIMQAHTSIPHFLGWIEQNTDYVSDCYWEYTTENGI